MTNNAFIFSGVSIEMPNTHKSHLDMLQLCCGICGLKKNQQQLRLMSECVLIHIKSIDGYKDYDINDDRYPKVICEQHQRAVREKVNNPSKICYEFSLPINVPHFCDISLPRITRASSSDFDQTHTCFLCEQNQVGRPKSIEKNNHTSSKICPKCFQAIGRGIPHPCVKSTKNSVLNITKTIQELKPPVQDQVFYSFIKSKEASNSTSMSKRIKLSTPGKPAQIEVNPSTSNNTMSIGTETLDNIRIQAGLSLTQMKIVEGGLRAELGRESIPPYYRKHASSQIKILENYFNVSKHTFITATNGGLPSDYTKLWTVWAPMVPLIIHINEYRNNDPSDYLIKVMADTGKGQTKVCFCIIPTMECSTNNSRSTYAEG